MDLSRPVGDGAGSRAGLTPPEETVYHLFLLLWLLFPLAFYCLVLGTINRRTQPLLVSGSWDFVGLLCALSGFLLIDGPLLIRQHYDRAEETIYRRDIENAAKDAPQIESDPKDGQKQESVEAQIASVQFFWWTVWALYFVVVLGGAALLVWARSTVSVIYNIDGPAFQDVLTRGLERLGLHWHLNGKRLLLQTDAAAGSPESECAVDSFPVMYHVTMRWKRDPTGLRGRVEEELARQLKEVVTYDNPAAGWFLSIASCLFGLVLMGVVIVVVGPFLPRWR
jgi:hypothetical protein